MQLKSIEPLPPLPYGGDRESKDPTPEQIAAMIATMPGKPVYEAADPQRRARLQTHGRSYRTQRDG